MSFSARMLLWALAVFACPLSDAWAQRGRPADRTPPEGPQQLVTISPSTTFFVTPLDDDGFLDPIAALNQRLSAGVTPESNAAVLYLRAGLTESGTRTEFSAEQCRLLGIDLPAETPPQFLDYHAFARQRWREAFAKHRWQEANPVPEPDSGTLAAFDSEYDRVLDQPWKAVDEPTAAAWIDSLDDALTLITAGSHKPHCWFPYVSLATDDEPQTVIAILLPNIQASRSAARALKSRAMLRIGEGQTAAAIADVQAMHRLARQIGRGGTLIELLVGVAIETMACDADAALIRQGQLTNDELRELANWLATLPPLQHPSFAISNTERLMLVDAVQILAKISGGYHDAPLIDRMSGLLDSNSQVSSGTIKLLANSLTVLPMDWDLVLSSSNARYDRLVAISLQNRPDRKLAFQAFEDELAGIVEQHMGSGLTWLALSSEQERSTVLSDILANLLMPAVRSCSDAHDRSLIKLELVQTAIALEKYRRAQGHFPTALSELSPQFLPSIPLDDITLQPLQYRLEADTYTLYSVGKNEVDDGGLSTLDGSAEEGGTEDDLVIRSRELPARE